MTNPRNRAALPTAPPRGRLAAIFRHNLLTVRRELGLGLTELGRRVGKTPGYISDLETGRRPGVKLETIDTIAWALGVNPVTLIATKLPAGPQEESQQ